jgi:cell volume regulation protein A
MNFTVDGILIVGSFLLFISILASKLSSRLGIPTLLIFLVIGMLAGSDGLGGIQFDSPYVAKVLGTITLTFILFAGGLETDFNHIRPILWNGIALSTIGVLMTTFGIGYFIHWVTDFNLIESMLMGAIISSTDAAAVFSILRSKNLNLKDNLIPTLELESGSNDAMAYFLLIFFSNMLIDSEGASMWAIIPAFLKEMCVGAIAGLLVGQGMIFIMNRIQLAYEALYPGITLAMILFTYSATNSIHGNGFLAVYIAGIMLGSRNFIHKNSLIHFYDGICWLMQVVMFLSMGLLVSPSKLIPIIGIGLLISAVLMFFVRPLSVFCALGLSKFGFKQKLFISWVGLRGAVPIVFATHPLLMHIDKADTIFHIVFFIVLTSILFQGTTLSPLAKWLKLEEPKSDDQKSVFEFPNDIKKEFAEVIVPTNTQVEGKKIVDLNLPKNALITVITREKTYIIPRGDTKIYQGDKLMIMTENKEEIHLVKKCLGIVA